MKELLIQCGLTSTEQAVLSYLLEFGRRRPSVVAAKLKMKRPTVYSALVSLSDMGLVEKEFDRAATLYRTIDPEKIPQVLEGNVSRSLQAVQKAAAALAPFMKSFDHSVSQNIGDFKVRELNGTRSYESVMMRYVTENDFCAIWNPRKAITSQRVRRRVQDYLARSGKRKSRIREILTNSSEAEWYGNQITNKNHLVKFYDGNLKTDTDVLLVKNRVIFCENGAVSESAIEIEHSGLAAILLEVFNSWWALLAKS